MRIEDEERGRNQNKQGAKVGFVAFGAREMKSPSEVSDQSMTGNK